MKKLIRIKNSLRQNLKKIMPVALVLAVILNPARLYAQYLELTPCAIDMIAGIDSMVAGLNNSSCTPNLVQHRTVLPNSCSMIACDPGGRPRIVYYFYGIYGNNMALYWHVRGAPLFWGYYGFCPVDTNLVPFPGGPGCSPNHVDRIALQRIQNGQLVNDSVPGMIAVKNPRLMTPSSPFWPLITGAGGELNNLNSGLGVIVDVYTPTGVHEATIWHLYNYGYIQWKQLLPCPTLNSLTHANVANASYGCKTFNFTPSVSGYDLLCPASILTAAWDFGDGTPVVPGCVDSTGAPFPHQYGAAGNYNISFSLTMTGTGTCSINSSDTVQVTCGPPPCSDCISSFAPQAGKKYLVSAWAKEKNAPQSKTSYTYPGITVLYPSISGSTGPFVPSGNIIDGWQRIEGEFTIPSNATDITLTLDCTSSDCYYDDVRLLPFDGSMKSYVYDPVSMRLTAELDERNYATLYEYDEDGKLIRVKKETERGKMTIQENRNNTKQ